MIRLSAVLFFLVIIINNVKAQFSSDRPGASESSYTVGKYNFQTQNGLQLSSNRLFEYKSEVISNRFRFGITESLELFTDINYQFYQLLDTIKGSVFNPIMIGVRKSISKGDGNWEPSIALSGKTTLPLIKNTSAFATNRWNGQFAAFFDHNFEKINVGYNLGFNLQYLPKTFSISPFYTLNMSFGKKVIPFVEVFGVYTSSLLTNFQNNITLNADAGVAFMLRKNLQIDLSVGALQPFQNYRTLFIDFGVTWKIYSLFEGLKKD